jgi:hypothetical protein
MEAGLLPNGRFGLSTGIQQVRADDIHVAVSIIALWPQ